MPSVLFRRVERLRELPGRHAARAEITNFAAAHERVERFEGFFDGSVRVPAMNLVEIDEIHAQAAQRVFAGFDDVLAAESAPVRALAHRPVNFRGHDDIVARRHLAEVQRR